MHRLQESRVTFTRLEFRTTKWPIWKKSGTERLSIAASTIAPDRAVWRQEHDSTRPSCGRPPDYFASQICCMNARLSQNKYSSSIMPSFQCPTVHITNLKDFPVGGIALPSGVGIGFVNVPSIMPITLVHAPEANLTGCSLMMVSGAYTNISFKSAMCLAIPLVRCPSGQCTTTVLRMALFEPFPFLVGENVKIQVIELCDVLGADEFGGFIFFQFCLCVCWGCQRSTACECVPLDRVDIMFFLSLIG
jgi:hypothetical protein